MHRFGLIVTSHGGLAEGLLSSAEMIVGKQQNVKTITLLPGGGFEEMRSSMERTINAMTDCDYVFIASDLYGGTPFNASLLVSQTRAEQIRLITGVNLPMLVQFFTSATRHPDQLVKEMETAGREGIALIAHVTADAAKSPALD